MVIESVAGSPTFLGGGYATAITSGIIFSFKIFFFSHLEMEGK